MILLTAPHLIPLPLCGTSNVLHTHMDYYCYLFTHLFILHIYFLLFILYFSQSQQPEYPLIINPKSYLKRYPKEQLVYLTPHCQEELLVYDHNAVYIIGGIVDKSSGEPLTLAKAKREGVRMQKLPLDR